MQQGNDRSSNQDNNGSRDNNNRDNNRSTIVFVLAGGPATGAYDDLMNLIVQARADHYAAVYILTSSARADDVLEAVRLTERKGFTLVQAIEYIGDLEVDESLSPELLTTMRVLAESSLDTYVSVLVIGAGKPILVSREDLEAFGC